MNKQDTFGAGLDLKRFFEASVGALKSDGDSSDSLQPAQRNGPLVPRTGIGRTPRSRAVSDAARALSALWKM